MSRLTIPTSTPHQQSPTVGSSFEATRRCIAFSSPAGRFRGMSDETDQLTDQELPSLIQAAYAPDTFQDLSATWATQLSEHMSAIMSGEGRVLNWSDPQELVDAASGMMHSPAGHSFSELIETALASGQNLHHPRYIGHQVPASIPSAALFDATGTVTNQPMAICEMGPWGTAVERAVLRALQKKIGWNPETCAGLLTSGGSLANMTALLTARNVCFPEAWQQGVPDHAVIVAQADAHYCVTRSAGILGIGTQRIVAAPLDDRRRMNPQQLDGILCKLKADGKKVIAVAAAACATPIGAFDPLDDIANVCEKHDVWLHVDAAHGGGTLMSSTHRTLVNGIERADSIVWDAHKMMFVPALCAAVLYRNKEHRYAAFQQDAPYLFDPSSPGLAEFDSGISTVECTKRTLGFGLWGMWSMYGEELFEQLIDHTFALTAFFHRQLTEAADFQPLHSPQCNIQVFRFVPESMAAASNEDISALQLRVRRALIESGDYYIVQTKLDGQAALRVTIINPLTTRTDLIELLNAIRRMADQTAD